jgi:hypothetical protein
VIGLSVHWVCSNFGRFTRQQRSIVELIALRAPDQFRQAETMSLLRKMNPAISRRVLIGRPVCTENLSSDVVVVKPAKHGV